MDNAAVFSMFSHNRATSNEFIFSSRGLIIVIYTMTIKPSAKNKKKKKDEIFSSRAINQLICLYFYIIFKYLLMFYRIHYFEFTK